MKCSTLNGSTRPLSGSSLDNSSGTFGFIGFNCFRSSGGLSIAFIGREGRLVVAVAAA